MDPIQGEFGPTARLWHGTAGGAELLEGSGKFVLKGGSQAVTLIEELSLPTLTTEQRVAVAIKIARHVVGDRCPKWSAWAEAWLSGRKRTEKAATAAKAVVLTTARAAAWAARAAALTAEAARAAEATEAARAAVWAAEAAEAAMETAEITKLNLAKILQEVGGKTCSKV